LNFDPGATLTSSSHSAATPLPLQVSPPLASSQQVNMGQFPEAATPHMEPPVPNKQRKRVALFVIAGSGALALICACGGFLWWIDTAGKWCDFFPFLFGSACEVNCKTKRSCLSSQTFFLKEAKMLS